MVRRDTFEVGDMVEWHMPTVMAHCLTWAPDVTKPTQVIAVRSSGNWHSKRAAGHVQQVRVSPNYSPYGDEFSGAWFRPVRREDQQTDGDKSRAEPSPNPTQPTLKGE